MTDELLYTQEEIDEWIRVCEELQEKIAELEQERKETAREIIRRIKRDYSVIGIINILEDLEKQYGVEVEE